MKKQVLINEDAEEEKGMLKLVDRENLRDKQFIIKSVFYILFGFTAALFPEEYVVSPFAAAAVASAEVTFSPLAFGGACLGYIVSRGFEGSVRYLITLTLVFASVKVAEKQFRTFDKAMVSAFFASIFVLLSDFTDMLTVRINLMGSILSAADALLCGCAVYFFSRSLTVPVSKTGIRRLSNYDAISLCITAACLICCVGRINIMGFYVFHIPACVLIIFCAFYGRISGGSVCGVLLGLILSFGCEMPTLFYMYALGGFFAGAFSFLGQYGCALVFAAASCLASFFGGSDFVLAPQLILCVLSSVIFMFIPSRLLCSAEEYLAGKGIKNDAEISMQVALNLKNAAKTVDSISDVVCSVNEKLSAITDPEMCKVLARIQHSVCSGCENKAQCWDYYFDLTVRDIQKIAKLKLNSRNVCPETLFGGTAERCQRFDALTAEIENHYLRYMNCVDTRIKIDEMRSVVSDQFSSMAQLLYDVSTLLSDEKVYDEVKSKSVRNVLRENRINTESATYRENSASRATVEIVTCEEPGKVNSEKIRRIISSQLRKKFCEAEVAVEDMFTVLTYKQKCEYDVSVGVKQIPCGDNTVCGDSVDWFAAGEGSVAAVISDGMGTGKRASLDADMTATIMNRLLSSGFTFKSALRLVNSALLIRGGEESLSTVDALSVNTYSGVCTFCKAGAAASYIRHDDKVYMIEKASLPVGILRNVDFASEEFKLEAGDVVLMTSDGVCGEDDEWIRETLLCWSTANMQELATHVADLARMKNEKLLPDDISVIALMIKKK